MSRPEHAPQGDPCKKCGRPAFTHRKRNRSRALYDRSRNAMMGRRASAHEVDRQVIAIDGEGFTDGRGRHRYTYLAAADTTGLVSELRCPRGARSSVIFSWLCTLPPKALLVGFSLGYDRTKWVEDWPDAAVWRLMRPEERQGEAGPLPVVWDGWRVNVVSSRMSLRREEDGARRTVWDVFKFFQSSFVKALERWTIGTVEERACIAREKKRRGSFKGIGPREEAYCQLECRLLAALVVALVDAHDEEDLTLPSYFGPGSTAAVILARTGAAAQRARVPEAMREAVACAYFGGRFECSRVGPVPARRLYAYDLASAYPAAFAELPCMKHGTWRYVDGSHRLDMAPGALACVRFVVGPHKDACRAWGPLPHRMPDGNILFPVASAGGWAWRDEYEAARALHPGVRATAAWLYRQECDCAPPFGATIRDLYERRKAWGKGARGIVLKLALNSLYGKSAQKVGKGKYRCMVRAGIVTSVTRAKLLRAVATARDPWSVLELATDSVLSTEPLPIEGEGLGAWERKAWPGGVFLLRPGLRFPLREDAPGSLTAARGVGPHTLHTNRAKVRRAWEACPMAPVTLKTPSFFHGAKLSVRRNLGPDESLDERAYAFVRDPLYGTWTQETRTVNYRPAPKRESVSVGPRGTYILHPWELPRGEDERLRSVPYDSGHQTPHADELDDMRELASDQDGSGGLALV